ncbi:MAG: ankyrin repeat domain-containing protein [Gammaproteobacteria bacterium]
MSSMGQAFRPFLRCLMCMGVVFTLLMQYANNMIFSSMHEVKMQPYNQLIIFQNASARASNQLALQADLPPRPRPSNAEQMADPSTTPLMRAIFNYAPNGDKEKKSKELKGIKSLLTAESVNQKNKWGDTPLFRSVNDFRPELVELLLKNGANPNVMNGYMAPMHLAAMNGYFQILQLLLAYNANIDIKDVNGKTPLHIAASNGMLEILDHLLSKGADKNSVSHDKRHPLVYATEHGHARCVARLLDYGAEVDKPVLSNVTALHVASFNGRIEIIEMLIQNNASLLARTDQGKSPYDLASENGQDKAALFLMKIIPELTLMQKLSLTITVKSNRFERLSTEARSNNNVNECNILKAEIQDLKFKQSRCEHLSQVEELAKKQREEIERGISTSTFHGVSNVNNNNNNNNTNLVAFSPNAAKLTGKRSDLENGSNKNNNKTPIKKDHK